MRITKIFVITLLLIIGLATFVNGEQTWTEFVGGYDEGTQ